MFKSITQNRQCVSYSSLYSAVCLFQILRSKSFCSLRRNDVHVKVKTLVFGWKVWACWLSRILAKFGARGNRFYALSPTRYSKSILANLPGLIDLESENTFKNE